MGQYYKPAILGDDKKTVKKWVYSHDIKTKYTRPDGTIFMSGSGLKLMEHSWLENPFVQSFETLLIGKPQRVVWAGDYADKESGIEENIYDLCEDHLKVKPKTKDTGKYFLINHTKKEFVDKSKVPGDTGWRIHPLPLLTSEGNGQGGGDFNGNEKGIVGKWARDLISLEKKVPVGFKELIFDLTE